MLQAGRAPSGVGGSARPRQAAVTAFARPKPRHTACIPTENYSLIDYSSNELSNTTRQKLYSRRCHSFWLQHSFCTCIGDSQAVELLQHTKSNINLHPVRNEDLQSLHSCQYGNQSIQLQPPLAASARATLPLVCLAVTRIVTVVQAEPHFHERIHSAATVCLDHLLCDHNAPYHEEYRDTHGECADVNDDEPSQVGCPQLGQYQIFAQNARHQVVNGQGERRDSEENFNAQQPVAAARDVTWAWARMRWQPSSNQAGKQLRV